MEAAQLISDMQTTDPIDMVESAIDARHWPSARTSEHEISAEVSGAWCDYSLFFSWSAQARAIHFTCAFDLRIPDVKKSHAHELLALINEQVWLGHFCLWNDDGLPMFRFSLPLRGVTHPSAEQIDDIVDTAISECDRFYPAFQFMLWGGRNPREALEGCLLETRGQA